MKRLVSLVVCLCFSANLAIADELDDKIEAALKSDIRTEAEQERDRNRKPLDTLKFFQLRDDMRVVELLPGGGWYTKILAPVLADNGKLYVALGTTRAEKVIKDEELDKVEIIDTNSEFTRDGAFNTYNLDKVDLPLSNIDLVLTFRNLHNLTPEGRDKVNRAVFAALKSGGLYGVVDHTARHMEPQNAENKRRLDPIIAIKELLAAGFEFVDYSDLHYRPDDELRYEVGRKSVTGNTDRFTLLFRKP